MNYQVELELENKTEFYAFDQVAKQANGAAWLKCGKTVILATVVIDETDFVDEDFLPLTVQYIEKSYAAGKFPGGFIKRETKPSDFETLTSRIVDRSLRPLFPKGFANPTQITIMVLSVDSDADLQVLALNAASAALYVSDIDINTSVSALRIAKIEGEVVFNPSIQELKRSTLDLYLAGSREELLMIEMRTMSSSEVELIGASMVDPMMDPALAIDTLERHSANALSEEELIALLKRAHELFERSNRAYEEAFAPHAKRKKPLILLEACKNHELENYVRTQQSEKIKLAINQMAKTERSTGLRQIRKAIMAEHADWNEKELKDAIEKVKREIVREQILSERRRADGRALDEIRPISIETNILPSAHASALFTRGQTQVLVVLTLGGDKDTQIYEDLTDSGIQNESFMVHYNFPGFCVGEPSPVGPPRRRELGHGNLAKRALEPAMINPGYTVRLVSEVLESNGSSSMATVCGGYLALRAGDITMSDTIAGIAMGMIREGERYVILSDIMGLEDHDGDMDFKVAGSKEGITAMQMDIKLGGVSLEILKEALYQAKRGRAQIIDVMQSHEASIELNEGILPTSDLFHIDPSFIGAIIGQAGKTIREIIEKFEVVIDIDKKKGQVKVSGKNRQGIKDARAHIEGIVRGDKAPKISYQVGDKVEGTVKKIVEFGAFIELPGGVDGLLHISKVADHRVENVADVLREGERIKVEILEFKGSKISLRRAN